MTPQTYRTCIKCNGAGKVPDRSRHQHPNWELVKKVLILRGKGFSYPKAAKELNEHLGQMWRCMEYAKRKNAPVEVKKLFKTLP